MTFPRFKFELYEIKIYPRYVTAKDNPCQPVKYARNAPTFSPAAAEVFVAVKAMLIDSEEDVLGAGVTITWLGTPVLVVLYAGNPTTDKTEHSLIKLPAAAAAVGFKAQ
jgi:hypothetical protein